MCLTKASVKSENQYISERYNISLKHTYDLQLHACCVFSGAKHVKYVKKKKKSPIYFLRKTTSGELAATQIKNTFIFGILSKTLRIICIDMPSTKNATSWGNEI